MTKKSCGVCRWWTEIPQHPPTLPGWKVVTGGLCDCRPTSLPPWAELPDLGHAVTLMQRNEGTDCPCFEKRTDHGEE